MRIAIFTDTFLTQINGLVRTIVTTANGLVARGQEVAIFTMDVRKIKAQAPHSSQPNELDDRVQIYTFTSLTSPWFKDIQLRIPTLAAPLSAAAAFGPTSSTPKPLSGSAGRRSW
jgi:hypothetical protein